MGNMAIFNSVLLCVFKSVEDRSDDDQRTVERILILVRNVLHVPPSPDSEQRPDNDASTHDQVGNISSFIGFAEASLLLKDLT